MPLSLSRKPFDGSKRGVILAFDLGTTFSGISYAILDPGKVPEIKTVTRYPGQEAGDSKVPTIIYYNDDSNLVAVGAEEPPINDGTGSDDGSLESESLKVEWFKLLLRPPTSTPSPDIPCVTLPPSEDVTYIFADFYAYLIARVHAFICETRANGDILWDSAKNNIRLVLSHPNGWEGAQQSAMRRAAVMAELMPDTPEGPARVTFVSEGEASFHYCVASGLMEDSVEKGKNVMVIDAGGGTVDISTYAFIQAEPVKIEEIAAAECMFQGSVLVSKRASDYLADKLKDSRFGTPEYIRAISAEVDRTTKKRFKGPGDSYVKFSSLAGDRDDQVHIRNGRLKLSAEEVAGFFQPTIDGIIDAIEAQQKAAAPVEVSTCLLVGGFASSEFLYTKLRDYLEGQGLKLIRPDSHRNKAVAEGAVSSFLDHLVSGRVAKVFYGSYTATSFYPTDPEHEKRREHMYMGADGLPTIGGQFTYTLPRGTRVAEITVFETKLWHYTVDDDHTISHDIVCYRGTGPCPKWVDENPDMLMILCTVTEDMSKVPRVEWRDAVGETYFVQKFKLVMSFGLTELKAHISWVDRGMEYIGPASVVYDDESPKIIAEDDSKEGTALEDDSETANDEAVVKDEETPLTAPPNLHEASLTVLNKSYMLILIIACACYSLIYLYAFP